MPNLSILFITTVENEQDKISTSEDYMIVNFTKLSIKLDRSKFDNKIECNWDLRGYIPYWFMNVEKHVEKKLIQRWLSSLIWMHQQSKLSLYIWMLQVFKRISAIIFLFKIT